MNDHVIATDHPLTTLQRQTLSALLDTILPGSDDERMLSAKDLDFVGYLDEKAAEFLPLLIEILGNFDEVFSGLSPSDRYSLVEAFSTARVELFEGLLFNIYSCYYQDDRVLEGIGMSAGPPFPGGNTIEPGDLSLLDPVMRKSRSYRKGD